MWVQERIHTDDFTLKAPGMNNKKAHGIEMPWAVELVGPPRAAFIAGLFG